MWNAIGILAVSPLLWLSFHLQEQRGKQLATERQLRELDSRGGTRSTVQDASSASAAAAATAAAAAAAAASSKAIDVDVVAREALQAAADASKAAAAAAECATQAADDAGAAHRLADEAAAAMEVLAARVTACEVAVERHDGALGVIGERDAGGVGVAVGTALGRGEAGEVRRQVEEVMAEVLGGKGVVGELESRVGGLEAALAAAEAGAAAAREAAEAAEARSRALEEQLAAAVAGMAAAAGARAPSQNARGSEIGGGSLRRESRASEAESVMTGIEAGALSSAVLQRPVGRTRAVAEEEGEAAAGAEGRVVEELRRRVEELGEQLAAAVERSEEAHNMAHGALQVG